MPFNGSGRLFADNLPCIAICVVALLTSGGAFGQTASVAGLGASSCSQFDSEIRANPQLQRDYFAWAQGFMSGILIRMPSGVDEGLELVPSRFPLLRQVEFLRQFCEENTAKDYSDAVIALYRVLRTIPSEKR